jgi:hypothetical protein
VQLLEFGQRFINFKAAVKIVNNHTGKIEFMGMFVDCPYRILRYAEVVNVEVDEQYLRIYITSKQKMFFDTEPHFSIDTPPQAVI